MRTYTLHCAKYDSHDGGNASAYRDAQDSDNEEPYDEDWLWMKDVAQASRDEHEGGEGKSVCRKDPLEG